MLPPTATWNDTTIGVTVPAGTPVGPHQLKVTANNGQSTVNGLTFHVRGGGYNPTVYEVGPGKTHATIQAALDAAFASSGDDLVVVYPGQPDLSNPRNNPRGAYYENLIIASPVKLQGVGPGGFQGNTFVPGSIIDGGAFGGDTALATAWYDKIGALTWDGNQAVNDGEAIYVLASQNATTANGAARQFTSGFKAGIDGFDIRGGDQQGFPGNINDLTGGPTGLPPNIVTQGGAIFANAYARYLQITNNVVQNNGGGYGTIRIGTPDLAGAGHQPAQRERPDRQQPDHRQRRHQPGRRHRALRRLGQLRSGRQRHLRQLLARVRRRAERLRLAARTARSTTTASTSTCPTTRAAAS